MSDILFKWKYDYRSRSFLFQTVFCQMKSQGRPNIFASIERKVKSYFIKLDNKLSRARLAGTWYGGRAVTSRTFPNIVLFYAAFNVSIVPLVSVTYKCHIPFINHSIPHNWQLKERMELIPRNNLHLHLKKWQGIYEVS